MVDATLDVLLEAVRHLQEMVRAVIVSPYFDNERNAKEIGDLDKKIEKLDALIAQRKGRSDDQPAR